MLLAMPMLTASPEMKQAAMADEPKKETTYYGHTYTTRTYFAYMNCLVQDGILKAAFFLPDHLRLDGNNPVYEVFLDKENRQFLTYDHLEKKWRDAKLDRLEWHGRNYYATCWVSEEDAALVQDYFSGERGGDLGILDFQRNVRDEQLERRHKRITDPWDKDLAQVPKLPKDWKRWADKVAVRENFIFYHYKRGGAKTGYCTFCGKEVPISGHPYHNKEGRCIRCRHPVVFKALGRAGYFQTDKYYAYLVQRCRDGFVVREFRADRTYRKDTLPHSEPYWHEFRRSIYDRTGEIRSYYWGMYCQRETRWISGSPCYYAYYGDQSGRVYGKTLPSLEKKELRQTGLAEWIRSHPITDPEKYLAVWERLPQMEQIWKAGLQRLTKECFHSCDNVRKLVLNPSEPGLIRALGLDASKFRRLRQMDGDTETLAWLQLEKRTGQRITDDMLRWSKKEQISAKDLVFIADRMSLVQIKNYLERQKEYFEYAGAAGGFIDKYGYPFCRGRVMEVVEKDEGQYDTILPVFWATGAALFIRLADYREAGGLDGRFFAHMEEIDLCWRLRSRGRKIVCIPQSTVYHVGGATLKKENPRKTFLNFRNNLVMLYKNLPDEELNKVMRIRACLDYVAAFTFLLKGQLDNARAVMRARKEYRQICPSFSSSRKDNLRKTSLNPIPERIKSSILWQFYVGGCKRFSQLSDLKG